MCSFEDISNTLEDYVAYYDGLVISEVLQDHADVRLGWRNNNKAVYLPVLVLGYCVTTARRFEHLGDIVHRDRCT